MCLAVQGSGVDDVHTTGRVRMRMYDWDKAWIGHPVDDALSGRELEKQVIKMRETWVAGKKR